MQFLLVVTRALMEAFALTDTILDGLNFTIKEALAAKTAAKRQLHDVRSTLAIMSLVRHAPAAEKESRDALHSSWFHILSEAGRGNAILLGGDASPSLASLKNYIDACLLDPVFWADPASWALFYAAREASDTIQLDICKAPTSESHISGALLGALHTSCETWRKIVAEPLGRLGVTLSLELLDLSILGGEQETGGDFAIIMDLRGSGGAKERRVVPIIFQAKRYMRPTAELSQYHPYRGYQQTLLARNDCTSAYILYENGKKAIDLPLPPLVKPVTAIAGALRTEAAEGSVELATYLVTELHMPGRTPPARDANEALRMVYKKSYPSRLAVISDDKSAKARYMAQLQALAPELKDEGQEENWVTTTE